MSFFPSLNSSSDSLQGHLSQKCHVIMSFFPALNCAPDALQWHLSQKCHFIMSFFPSLHSASDNFQGYLNQKCHFIMSFFPFLKSASDSLQGHLSPKCQLTGDVILYLFRHFLPQSRSQSKARMSSFLSLISSTHFFFFSVCTHAKAPPLLQTPHPHPDKNPLRKSRRGSGEGDPPKNLK